jgi:hypothetical protein
MNRTRNLPRAIAVCGVVAVLVLSACSTKAKGGSDTGSSGGVKTGPGVTDSSISLGVLTDLSGVFAVLGKSVTQGAQLYFNDLNKAGGICGRTVKLVIKDDGYDVQKAVTAYAGMKYSGWSNSLGRRSMRRSSRTSRATRCSPSRCPGLRRFSTTRTT